MIPKIFWGSDYNDEKLCFIQYGEKSCSDLQPMKFFDYCQTPVLGLGQGVDFTLANNNNNKNNKNKKNNPHLNFLRRNGTMSMKFCTQT